MKLVFLQSCTSDLVWMRRYYRSVFPQGSVLAQQQFIKTKNLIKTNPYIGEAIPEFEGAREFPVIRTPFSIIYRIHEGRIEVLRVVDNRSDWVSKDD